MNMTIKEFTKFNESIYYDSTITPDFFTPLADPHPHHITATELTQVLKNHFRADKSSGLSPMPLHLLKHLGPAGIQCLTQLFNCSAID
jgi:hypothetical protein